MKLQPVNTSQTFNARKAPDIMERYYARKSKSLDKKLEYSFDMLDITKSTPNAWDFIKHSSKIIWNLYKIAAYKALSLYYAGKKEI